MEVAPADVDLVERGRGRPAGSLLAIEQKGRAFGTQSPRRACTLPSSCPPARCSNEARRIRSGIRAPCAPGGRGRAQCGTFCLPTRRPPRPVSRSSSRSPAPGRARLRLQPH
eukprot:4042176-Pyramimonas_sp.AAC.1